MDRVELALLEALDVVVWRALAEGRLDAAARRVRATLARESDAALAWEAVPLTLDGCVEAPDDEVRRRAADIRSCWIFLLRRGISTGAERHPNSVQRVMSYRGSADMQTWDRHWRQNPLRSDPRAAVEERWLSIPRNVWHRPRIGPHADWMVISFHTAGAADLIEERARDDENPDAGSTSEAYAGRRSR